MPDEVPDGGGSTLTGAYSITIDIGAANGISSNRPSADENDHVYISTKPGAFILFGTLDVKTEGGADVDARFEDGSYTFDMPAENVVVNAVITDKIAQGGGSLQTIDQDQIYTFTYENASAIGGTIDAANGQAAYNFTVNAPIENAQVLVVAGGGGGGATHSDDGSYQAAAGGGAGKVIYGMGWTISDGTYEIKVGRGGKGTAGGSIATSTNNNGKDSSIKIGSDTLTAKGGGAGGSLWGGTSSGTQSGGSGGGGVYGGNGETASTFTPPPPTVFAGFTAYGNKGGKATYTGTGGGGGASEAGKDAVDNKGGDGGAGLPFDISGTEVWYAGGGSAGAYKVIDGNEGAGGQGGGGDINNPHGAPRTGGGGAGGTKTKTPPASDLTPSPTDSSGGDGGSGIVIIRFPYVAP